MMTWVLLSRNPYFRFYFLDKCRMKVGYIEENQVFFDFFIFNPQIPACSAGRQAYGKKTLGFHNS